MAIPLASNARTRLSTVLQSTFLVALWLTQGAQPRPDAPARPGAISLLDIPNELILMIAEHIESPKDLNSLLKANQRLASLLNPVLRKRKPVPNFCGMTPIQWASWHGDIGLVREELEKGCDINERAVYRAWTPLHFAAQSHPDIYKLLLEHGADPDAEDTIGKKPAHYTTPRPARNERFF